MRNATSSDGEYLPSSIAFTVCRVTPILSASSCCVISRRSNRDGHVEHDFGHDQGHDQREEEMKIGERVLAGENPGEVAEVDAAEHEQQQEGNPRAFFTERH